jgi:hypothetical protein
MPYKCKCIIDPSDSRPAEAHPSIAISFLNSFAYGCIAAVIVCFLLVLVCRKIEEWNEESYNEGWEDGMDQGRQDVLMELLETDSRLLRTEVNRLCMEEGVVGFDEVEITDSEEDSGYEDFEPDTETLSEGESESECENESDTEADLDDPEGFDVLQPSARRLRGSAMVLRDQARALRNMYEEFDIWGPD